MCNNTVASGGWFTPNILAREERIFYGVFGSVGLIMGVAFAILGVPIIHCAVGLLISSGLLTSAIVGARGYYLCAAIAAFGLHWAAAFATGSFRIHTWVEYNEPSLNTYF